MTAESGASNVHVAYVGKGRIIRERGRDMSVSIAQNIGKVTARIPTFVPGVSVASSPQEQKWEQYPFRKCTCASRLYSSAVFQLVASQK